MKKFVHSKTLERLKKLDEELDRVAKDPEDQKGIHDLRVAIRRLSQCFRTFVQFLKKAKVKTIRKDLRKLMDLCGAARNYDIALEVLQSAGVEDSELNQDLEERRRRAKKELASKLPSWEKSGKTRHWPSGLHVTRHAPGPWDLGEKPAENARKVLPGLAAELFKAGDTAAAGTTFQKLHRFRLKVKRFRYTFELFQPLYQVNMEAGDTMLRGLQDKLGAVSDCGATSEILKKHPEAAAAVLRLLAKREVEFRKYWEAQCGPEMRQWWKTTLSGTDGETSHGSLHPKTRRSGTAGSGHSGQRAKADREG